MPIPSSDMPFQHTHDQTTDDRADDRAHAARDGRSADERRRDRVEFEHVADLGVGQVEAGREDDPGEGSERAHVDEDPQVDALDLHAGEHRRVEVAADGVDVPAEDAALGDRRVHDHQDAKDDQDDREAVVVRELPREPHDDGAGQDDLEHEAADRADLLPVPLPRRAGPPLRPGEGHDPECPDDDREEVVALAPEKPVREVAARSAGGTSGMVDISLLVIRWWVTIR